MKDLRRPENKISRQEIAQEFGVTTRTVIRWEEYGFIPKGQKHTGYGPISWYEKKDVQKLKKKVSKD